MNRPFKVMAITAPLQQTDKIAIKGAASYFDAAQSWLNHKSNREYAGWNLSIGRHEGYSHHDGECYREYRFTATDKWNLKAITIWVEGFSHTD
jgi:hypothetical protein